MQEDKIISVLIGLVGACNNNPKTENTDYLVIKALVSSSDPHSVNDIADEIRAEKSRIAPGCAVCVTPCGNTSDYDMSRIYNAEAEIRKVKLQILSEIRESAIYICQNEALLSDEKINFFYKALSCISYDLDKNSLLSLLDEAQEIKRKFKET